jgi:hypothetical protein
MIGVGIADANGAKKGDGRTDEYGRGEEGTAGHATSPG